MEEIRALGRLTAERSDGRVNWLDENALAMKLCVGRVRWIISLALQKKGAKGGRSPRESHLPLGKNQERVMNHPFLLFFLTHLVKSIGIDKNPSQLDNLCGVLGHIDPVLVAGRGDVDDHVPVDFEGRALLCRHCHDLFSVGGTKFYPLLLYLRSG